MEAALGGCSLESLSALAEVNLVFHPFRPRERNQGRAAGGALEGRRLPCQATIRRRAAAPHAPASSLCVRRGLLKRRDDSPRTLTSPQPLTPRASGTNAGVDLPPIVIQHLHRLLTISACTAIFPGSEMRVIRFRSLPTGGLPAEVRQCELIAQKTITRCSAAVKPEPKCVASLAAMQVLCCCGPNAGWRLEKVAAESVNKSRGEFRDAAI